MMKHYCKAYLLIAIVFFAVSVSDTGNFFFAFYPCLLCGMIPVNLLGYDERNRFLQYSAALPVSKTKFVSEKYLLGLSVQAVMLCVTGMAQGIKMSLCEKFKPAEFGIMMVSVLIISTLSAAIPLPFIFKYGAEKGRAAYYVMIGFVCAAGVLFSEFFKGNFYGNLTSEIVFSALTVLGICIFVLSWYLSVVFYKKREL